MGKYLFDPDTLMYEIQEESRMMRIVRKVGLVVLCVGMVVLYSWLYVYVLKLPLPKKAFLESEKAVWEARMDIISRRLDSYNRTLKGIEDRDDDVYRSIYGLDELAHGKPVGVDAGDFSSRVSYFVERIDNMIARSVVQNSSLDTVRLLAEQAGDMISCVPAVPPLMPDENNIRMTSSFGGRTDPVYGGFEFHPGQDFACPTGEAVYATGDGVVVASEMSYYGYGNMVLIDHGYGYRTRYAHLSAIAVKSGMKISRGDRVGTVGRTGKATGPHLHYEVEYKGRKMNPMSYMDMSMPVSEYRSMIYRKNEGKTGI